jgi:hypothetical protein
MSPECSGPRTYVGSVGSAAPIAMKHSSAVRKMPTEAARPGRAKDRTYALIFDHSALCARLADW